MIYIFLNFPVFALIYFWNLYGLSRTLELDDPEKYKKIAPLNPLNKTRSIGPFSLFSKGIVKDWEKYKVKIALTKWSLIYTMASFVFMGMILIMMVP